jgi:hypothetical protein
VATFLSAPAMHSGKTCSHAECRTKRLCRLAALCASHLTHHNYDVLLCLYCNLVSKSLLMKLAWTHCLMHAAEIHMPFTLVFLTLSGSMLPSPKSITRSFSVSCAWSLLPTCGRHPRVLPVKNGKPTSVMLLMNFPNLVPVSKHFSDDEFVCLCYCFVCFVY